MCATRYFLPVIILLTACLQICSCSGKNPLQTEIPQPDSATSTETPTDSTVLLGYYDVEFDPVSKTVSANMNRHAMTTWNVVKLMDNIPASLTFNVNFVNFEDEYTDVDVDVTITHPYDGAEKLNIYGVRGIFIGDGSKEFEYYGETMVTGAPGIDQTMLNDPVNLDGGGPDGYTRWFNAVEFYNPGLLGYYKGNFSTPNYVPTAILNPYKMFADGLGPNDDLWDFLIDTNSKGLFSAGSSNTRNYYIRFPKTSGFKFSYAVAAVWNGPNQHPARVWDMPSISVVVTDNVYYENEVKKGGKIILDVSVWDWGNVLVDDNKDYLKDFRIYLASPLLSIGKLYSKPEVDGGNFSYSTCHLEIGANYVPNADFSEVWIGIRRYAKDYSNGFGVPNSAAGERLSTFFRTDITILNDHVNHPPVADFEFSALPPWVAPPYDEGFSASASWDPDYDNLEYSWDFDGDLIFSEEPDDSYTGSPEEPTHTFYEAYSGDIGLRVNDGYGGFDEIYKYIEVVYHPKFNLPLRETVEALDLTGQEQTGDLLILYDDGQVWKYTYDNFYLYGEFFFQTVPGCDRIEVADDGTVIIGNTEIEWAASYDADGQLVSEHQPLGKIIDVFYYQPEALKNYHGVLCETDEPGFNLASIVYPPPYYGTQTVSFTQNAYGPGKLNSDSVLSCDNAGGDGLLFLEGDPEYQLELFLHDFGTYILTYFGEHSETNGFWDPVDFSYTQGWAVILDKLSTGAPAVKFSYLYYGSLYTYSNTDAISGEPYRISSCHTNYNSTVIFVLHSDGLSNFFLVDNELF